MSKDKRSDLSADLQEVLADIEEFLDDRHDIIDGLDGQPRPNWAMSLSTALKRALGELP